MTSLQFQYSNIVHYARGVTMNWRDANHKQRAMEESCSKERKAHRRMQTELLEMKTRVAVLEKAEAQLQKWESRRALISHYLGVVKDMSELVQSSSTKDMFFVG